MVHHKVPARSVFLAFILLLSTIVVLGLVSRPAPASAKAQETAGFFSYFAKGGVSQNATRYDIVILNEWNYGEIPKIKKVNPSAKVLLYKDSPFLRKSDSPSTVQGFATVSTQHPEWFLLDSQGKRITLDYFGNGDVWYFMDWGHPGWQEYYASRSIAAAKAKGFDGIFADDLYVRRKGALSNYPVQYPSDDALRAAVRSFLKATHEATREAGLIFMGNVSFDQLLVPGLWADWLQFSDGFMQENFVSTESGPQTVEGQWRQQLESVRIAESMGKTTLNVSQGVSGDRESMAYSYASYLLACGGRGLYYHALDGDYDLPATWYELWGRDLGRPQGPYTVSSDGVYSRIFDKGRVFVNPSKTKTVTVTVSGLVDEGGAPVTSVTLKPVRGVVLFTAPTTTTTVPPAPTTTTTAPPAPTTTTAPPAPTTTTTARPAPTTTTVAPPAPAPTTTTTAPPAPTTTTTAPPAPTTTTTAPAPAKATTPANLPVIQFVKPIEGAVVKGRVSIEVKAVAAAGILKVELLVDGKVLGTDKTAPYRFTWNTDRAAEGDHTLLAVGYDRVGNVAGTAITVKKVTSVSSTAGGAAIAASSYRYSQQGAFVTSTGVRYVQ